MKDGQFSDSFARERLNQETSSWWGFLVTIWAVSVKMGNAFTHSEKVSVKTSKYLYLFLAIQILVKSFSQGVGLS